jgi:hypothetical protein
MRKTQSSRKNMMVLLAQVTKIEKIFRAAPNPPPTQPSAIANNPPQATSQQLREKSTAQTDPPSNKPTNIVDLTEVTSNPATSNLLNLGNASDLQSTITQDHEMTEAAIEDQKKAAAHNKRLELVGKTTGTKPKNTPYSKSNSNNKPPIQPHNAPQTPGNNSTTGEDFVEAQEE